MALFGGKRAIWIEPAGDEIADGVEALLEAPAGESPVVAIAGSLRKTSALLKLAEAIRRRCPMSPMCPKAATWSGWSVELGARVGLRIAPELAAADCRGVRQQPGDRGAGTGQVCRSISARTRQLRAISTHERSTCSAPIRPRPT